MISDKQQIRKLQNARDLIQDVLDGEGPHASQSVYLSVAGDYCHNIAEIERQKANIDRGREVKSMAKAKSKPKGGNKKPKEDKKGK